MITERDRTSGGPDTFDFDFLHRTPSTAHQQIIDGVGIRISPSAIPQVIPTDNPDCTRKMNLQEPERSCDCAQNRQQARRQDFGN